MNIQHRQSRRCPLCRDWMPISARFCGTCGEALAPVRVAALPGPQQDPPARLTRMGLGFLVTTFIALIFLPPVVFFARLASIPARPVPDPVMPNGQVAHLKAGSGATGGVWVDQTGGEWTYTATPNGPVWERAN